MSSQSQIAVGHWHEILPAFGIAPNFLINKHGPCPGCGGKDRFRFDDKNGKGTWYCGGGGNPSHGDGYGLLCHVLGWDNTRAYREVQAFLKGTVPEITPVSKQPKRNRDSSKYGLRLWHERERALGDFEVDQSVRFHQYAKAKGIDWPAGALRHKRVNGRVVGCNSDCLLIPIRDLATHDVVAVQAINHAGEKQTFGSIRGHAFICGNPLDKSVPWYTVEGWADAVSLVFHEYHGNAVALAAMGLSNMLKVAHRAAEVFTPDQITILEDAA